MGWIKNNKNLKYMIYIFRILWLLLFLPAMIIYGFLSILNFYCFLLIMPIHLLVSFIKNGTLDCEHEYPEWYSPVYFSSLFKKFYDNILSEINNNEKKKREV